MRITILFSVVGFLLSTLASSEELPFSNSTEWLVGLKGEWSVGYFFESSLSTDGHRSSVKYVDGRFRVELADGPIKTSMLYHNNIYVCDLRRDENGNWYAPKLSHIVFDIRALEPLRKDEYVAFHAVDSSSGFGVGLKAGEMVERLVEQGSKVELSVVDIDRKKFDSTTKALILVADANHGVVTLTGDIRGKWSINVAWSSRHEKAPDETSQDKVAPDEVEDKVKDETPRPTPSPRQPTEERHSPPIPHRPLPAGPPGAKPAPRTSPPDIPAK